MDFTSWEHTFDGKDTDALMHYGVQGMKWGVRKYQNPDGSLTSAGKERYSRSPEALGFHPMKGKRGDVVQRSIGKTQIKLAKKAKKLESKAQKDLQKNNGTKSDKYKKLMEKARQAVEAGEFGKKMQKTYYNMALTDQKKMRSGYHAVRNGMIASLVVPPVIAGAVAGAVSSSRKQKLASKAAGDRNHLYEKMRKNRYIKKYV